MRSKLSPAFAILLVAVFVVRLATSGFAQQPETPSSRIKAALAPFVERHELAGAVVAVASRDKVLALESVGFADVAAARPMPENALFWIASQSKPMTVTAFMMLVDEGKVRVDDPVEKYLPEFKGQMVTAEKDEEHVLLRKPARPVAIRDVLSHTSGLPFSSPVENPTLDALPLRIAVRSYSMLPLQWEPRTRYQYSNAGINTVARIIEVIGGVPYQDFMQQRLFDPLGMKDTTFWPTEEQVSRLAKTYKPSANKRDLEEGTITQVQYPLSDRSKRFPMPAGGLFSTTQDAVRFCQMILNGGSFEGRRYISEAALKQMTTRQTPPEIKDSYGFGWAVGDGWCGHGGAYATNMTVDFTRGLVLVYHVQHAGFPGDGAKAQEAFRKVALAEFGSSQQVHRD